MNTYVRPCLVLFALQTMLTGILYPALITLVTQVAFPHQANGSLIIRDGNVWGSNLIDQSFDDSKYFWRRPSATGPFAYNSSASSGSNLGRTNPSLLGAIKGRVQAIRAAHPNQKSSVPIDLVTASGSGLDPHISPAAAEF